MMCPLGGSRRQGKGGELDRDGSLGWSLVTGGTLEWRRWTGLVEGRPVNAPPPSSTFWKPETETTTFVQKFSLSLFLSAPSPIIKNFLQIYVSPCPIAYPSFPLLSLSTYFSPPNFVLFCRTLASRPPPLPAASDLYGYPHISNSEFQIYSSVYTSPPGFFFCVVNWPEGTTSLSTFRAPVLTRF